MDWQLEGYPRGGLGKDLSIGARLLESAARKPQEEIRYAFKVLCCPAFTSSMKTFCSGLVS
jgi:hypothetical protein